jgi:hypothetical protein
MDKLRPARLLERYRSYVINYNLEDLVRVFVEAYGGRATGRSALGRLPATVSRTASTQ